MLQCCPLFGDLISKLERFTMATEQLDMISSDIVPQKTLNNIDSMYYYLKQKLNDAKQITDLIPFIEKLMNMNEIQQHLHTSLDKHYKSVETKSDLNIRSLFVSLFSLNGIPSDNIHAHILSFLPSTEYKKLSLLSKHFKFICSNHPYLYNNMGYIVQLQFSVDSKTLSEDSKTGVDIYHKQERWGSSLGVNFAARNKMDPTKLTSNDINNLIIPISQIKRWKIKEEYVWRDLGQRQLSKKNDFEDGHNKYLCEELLKIHSNKIEKLQVQLKNADIIQNVFNVWNTFNQCTILSIMDSKDLKLRKGTFTNLQCLELETDQEYSFDAEMSSENVNNIIRSTSTNLKCFHYKCSKPRRYRVLRGNMNKDETICIPADIEWLSIETNAPETVVIDMSECNKLIGVQLIGIKEEHITWPKNKTSMIPFVCISDGMQKIKERKLNIKAICLLKKQTIADADDYHHPWREARYKWIYDECDGLDTVSVMDALSESKNEEKCMVLDRDACDGMLFYRVLEYAIKDENKRENILNMCKRWWYLGSAGWLKKIARL